MCSGKRGVSSEEMIAIDAISDFPYPSPRGIRLIPVIDWISAGKLAKSDVPLPEDLSENSLRVADLGPGQYYALKVQGNSMDRVSPDGSIILVDRSDITLIGGKYYIFSLNGEATFKRWHGGDPAYLEPFSTDPSHGPIFVKNKKGLATLGRVKRTILDL
jgi:SOS-response transcriptional repressor LexA